MRIESAGSVGAPSASAQTRSVHSVRIRHLAAALAPAPRPTYGRPDDGSLRQCLHEHAYALNAIRLLLALLVLYSHAHPLGGYGPEPTWFARGHTTLGGFAVGAFFALSGLLVTMSGLRRTPYEYLRSRLLRIVPAYAFVLVAVATVLAPLVWRADHGRFSGYFNLDPSGPVHYVLRNLLFPSDLQHGIHDVFATTTPYGDLTGASAVNGSLWTLPYELRCYIVALAIVILGRWLGPTRVTSAALVYLGGVIALTQTDPVIGAAISPSWLGGAMPQLLFAFLCGALLGTHADRIQVAWPLVAAASSVFVGSALVGGVWFRAVGLGSLAILLPAVASRLPARRLAIFRHDLSYGAYLWAFPLQQTAAYVGWNEHKLVYLGSTSAATLAFAAFSWFVIERPLLAYRRSARHQSPSFSCPQTGGPQTAQESDDDNALNDAAAHIGSPLSQDLPKLTSRSD